MFGSVLALALKVFDAGLERKIGAFLGDGWMVYGMGLALGSCFGEW